MFVLLLMFKTTMKEAGIFINVRDPLDFGFLL